MGLVMAAIMGLGAWGGWKIDQIMGNKKFPGFTMGLTLLSVFFALYYFIRDVSRKK